MGKFGTGGWHRKDREMTEQNDNMKIWDAVKRPPSTALKQIRHGNLKGKSDISPQWRLQVMTEQFGPIGKGWSYEIKEHWMEPAGQDIMCFVQIDLVVKGYDMPIPGVGGSKVYEYYTSKSYGSANDEGYKMALTDALSVAMKQLGVAADIYAGLWDGSKYKDDVPQQQAQQPAPKEEITLDRMMSKKGIDFLKTCVDADEAKSIIATKWNATYGDKVQEYLEAYQNYKGVK